MVIVAGRSTRSLARMATRPGISMQSWITCGLIALSVIYSAGSAIAVNHGVGISDGSRVLWLLVFSVLVTLWAKEDRCTIAMNRDYSWFLMFFFWPAVLAYHLIKSRRIEGAMVYVGFLAVYLAPNYAQLVTWVCCGQPSS
jgi:hypothetical protein